MTKNVIDGNIYQIRSNRFYSKSKFPKKEVNMLSIIKSMSLQGLEGYLIDVQVDVAAGMPNWGVVGLPDTSVKEAKERVRTAIKNSGYEFPSRRIVINLAPADLRKEGSFYDLPIAVGILMDLGEIQGQSMEKTVVIGELSLNGQINHVNGILPMCIEAKKLGIKRVILPKKDAEEAAIVEGLQIIGVETLKEVTLYLNQEQEIEATKTNLEKLFYQKQIYPFDFAEVKGQENIKRALEIAAARFTQCTYGPDLLVQEKPCLLEEFPLFYQI